MNKGTQIKLLYNIKSKINFDILIDKIKMTANLKVINSSLVKVINRVI